MVLLSHSGALQSLWSLHHCCVSRCKWRKIHFEIQFDWPDRHICGNLIGMEPNVAWIWFSKNHILCSCLVSRLPKIKLDTMWICWTALSKASVLLVLYLGMQTTWLWVGKYWQGLEAWDRKLYFTNIRFPWSLPNIYQSNCGHTQDSGCEYLLRSFSLPLHPPFTQPLS